MRGVFSRFLHDRAGSAGEFALILPLFVLFFLGIIDAGRYAWAFNRGEKATQTGTRFTVVTNPVAPELATWNLNGVTVGSTTLGQGDRIPAAALGSITCTSTACAKTGNGPTVGTPDSTAFTNLANRMKQIWPEIQNSNIEVIYRGSGLGYAGNPNGMDIAPFVTVRLKNMTFSSLFLFGGTVSPPGLRVHADDGRRPRDGFELMGSNIPLELGKEFALQLSRPLTVFAVSEQIEALQASRTASWVGDAEFHALPLDAPISTDAIEAGRIIIVQVDTRVPQSMERIRHIRLTRPDLIQIVALDNADARMVRTLVREGVTDVVGLPLDPEEILQVAVAVAEVASRNDKADSPLAPLVAITRSSGGGGATTIATHLASVLTQRGESGKTCCIVDLDIQFGQVAEFLGARPKRTLADLIEAGDRLDSTMIRSVAVEVGNGVSVVAAPFEIVPVESLEPAVIQSVIELICREFDYVVIDMPADLTNWGLSLLARTDMIVLLCQQSLPSLRQARRRVDLFRNVGINMHDVVLVANQVERKLFGSLSLGAIAEAVGHDVLGGIALDEKVVQAAQDEGVLADRIKAGSNFVTDLGKIGAQIRDRLEKGRGL